MRKTRLLINYATPDLDAFEQVASGAAVLSERYDVRLVVSHFAHPDRSQRIDPGDPYLEYAVNFPDLFRFAPPDAVAPFVDGTLVEANVRLAQQKLAILERYGLRGAFVGREPVYLPEPFFRDHPDLRGPRVDHPRRSRNPCFALCLHHPDAQALYRSAAAEAIRRLPGVDTFYWWTNDSGAGFCWYEHLYPGPNGPQTCRAQGPVPAMAAFHAAVIDGARAQGVAEPMSVMTHTRVWEGERQPAGAFRYPPEGGQPGAASIAADLSLTYPVRLLWDPFQRLEQIEALGRSEPVAVMWWLSDVYHRAAIGAESARRQIALWALAAREPERNRHLSDRTALLAEHAAAEFDPAAAGVVDAWAHVHDAFKLQQRNPFRGPSRYHPTYGPVSHRWLTRPIVAFPEALSPEEEASFLPHVFAVGDDARRANLLDLHGYPAADEAAAHDLRSDYYDQIAAELRAAAGSFATAARAVEGKAGADLAALAKAAGLLACLWLTCRNWIEFAVLRAQGEARRPEEMQRLNPAERARAESYRQRVDRVMRAELDNVLAFQALLGADREGIVVRGATPEEEDTFMLSPHLQDQLTRKREIMLARWQDTSRLAPKA
jgi:hypothetical protein